MSVINCKMCGGNLIVEEGSVIAECEYCGRKQTIPTVDDEKKLTLFARAGRLLRACEFDKAAGIFEAIVADFPEEAEAYWGLVLCRFGIEYVDDPATGSKVPTCHRSGFDSVMEDKDFEQACENAVPEARRLYREEAKQIEELRKAIIEVSGKEEPYDIFICYKETADDGQRTIDSVLAQDIYEKLTDAGYRVFFSRITLEDKLGTEYEPYIFAALNSAKIMLAFGTDYEHFNAVWVKNEWSRFLKLMEKDKSKRLIPCYRDIDAYDMPKEFAKLQAQDMGKVGADQDLIRAIKKLISKGEDKSDAPQSVQQVLNGSPSTESLLKRAYLFLEEGDFVSADKYAEKALDIDPENAEGYLVKLFAKLKLKNDEEFVSFVTGIGGEYEGERKLRLNSYTAEKDEAIFALSIVLENEVEAKTLIEKLPQDIIVTRGASNYLQNYFSIYMLGGRVCCEVISDPYYAKFMRFANADRAEKVKGLVQTANKLFEENERRWVEAEAENRIKKERAQKEARIKIESIRRRIAPAQRLICAGNHCTFGLKADGTVLTNESSQFNLINESRDTVAICSGRYYTVGIRKDGSVFADGVVSRGVCSVSDWSDVIAVSVMSKHTIALKSDGTVVADGNNNFGQCRVSDWNDIVDVSTGIAHTVGLKADGSVVAVGDNTRGQCNVSGWLDTVAISAGISHTVGLKSDGTVVAVGDNYSNQCNISDWEDIVAISAGGSHTVGLKADGTVVAVGNNPDGRCNVSAWENIVAVSAGGFHTVGLKADGTIVAVGDKNSCCGVSSWKLFDSFDKLEDERREAVAERAKKERKEDAERAEKERKVMLDTLIKRKAEAEKELANLKGLFTGKRRKELEAELSELNKRIAALQKA